MGILSSALFGEPHDSETSLPLSCKRSTSLWRSHEPDSQDTFSRPRAAGWCAAGNRLRPGHFTGHLRQWRCPERWSRRGRQLVQFRWQDRLRRAKPQLAVALAALHPEAPVADPRASAADPRAPAAVLLRGARLVLEDAPVRTLPRVAPAPQPAEAPGPVGPQDKAARPVEPPPLAEAPPPVELLPATEVPTLAEASLLTQALRAMGTSMPTRTSTST